MNRKEKMLSRFKRKNRRQAWISDGLWPETGTGPDQELVPFPPMDKKTIARARGNLRSTLPCRERKQ